MTPNSNRIALICFLNFIQFFLLFLVYDQWGRHLIDFIASSYLPPEELCQAGNKKACEAAIIGFSKAQLYGYALFAIIFYFGSSLLTTIYLIGKRHIILKQAIALAGFILGIPFLTFYVTNWTSIGYAVFHFSLLFLGFALACFWRQKNAV